MNTKDKNIAKWSSNEILLDVLYYLFIGSPVMFIFNFFHHYELGLMLHKERFHLLNLGYENDSEMLNYMMHRNVSKDILKAGYKFIFRKK